MVNETGCPSGVKLLFSVAASSRSRLFISAADKACPTGMAERRAKEQAIS